MVSPKVEAIGFPCCDFIGLFLVEAPVVGNLALLLRSREKEYHVGKNFGTFALECSVRIARTIDSFLVKLGVVVEGFEHRNLDKFPKVHPLLFIGELDLEQRLGALFELVDVGFPNLLIVACAGIVAGLDADDAVVMRDR